MPSIARNEENHPELKSYHQDFVYHYAQEIVARWKNSGGEPVDVSENIMVSFSSTGFIGLKSRHFSCWKVKYFSSVNFMVRLS